MEHSLGTLDQNKRIVSDFFKAFSSGNADAIVDYMAPDCRWWISGNLPGISGTYSRGEMLELLRGVVNLYTLGALSIKETAMTAESNRVAAEAESFAELKNGRLFNNTYHFLFVIEGGKFTRIKEYSDTFHLHEVFVAT